MLKGWKRAKAEIEASQVPPVPLRVSSIYCVSHEGMQPTEAKVHAVQELATPHATRELIAVLGSVGYYRRFIKDLAKVVVPLCALLLGEEARTSQNGVFKWNKEAEQSFQELKQLLTSAPILAYADYNLPFVLLTDGSLKELGAKWNKQNQTNLTQHTSV